MKMKLWHCTGARSLRPLWTLEELGMDYDIEILPFPPRIFTPEYLETNALGTVPYFTHGDVTMTESCGICHYLTGLPGGEELAVPADHPDYGQWLNWLYHADATLTFPQTIVLRYTVLEPSEEKQAVSDDYARWFVARLRRLNAHLEQHEYLAADRFTIADIAVAYALYFGESLKLTEFYKPQTLAYLERMKARPGFQRADAIGREEALE